MNFLQTVIIEPYVSKDAFHKSTYGEGVSVPANVQDITSRDSNGKVGAMTTVSAWVALPPSTSITNEDRITLPNGSVTLIKSLSLIENYRTGSVQYIEVNIVGV
jgi:hypothetical protein